MKGSYFKRLKIIKERYLIVEKKITNRPAGVYHRACMIDPYSIYQWHKIFTPIEKNVWEDIRIVGLPFYPQYPIGKYFADFADPIKKIVIEVDGAEYHQDQEKDKERQAEVEAMGWTVIRIPGRKTYQSLDEYYDYIETHGEDDRGTAEDILSRLKSETSRGILMGILDKYYKPDE